MVIGSGNKTAEGPTSVQLYKQAAAPFDTALQGLVSDQGFQAQRAATMGQIRGQAGDAFRQIETGSMRRGVRGGGAYGAQRGAVMGGMGQAIAQAESDLSKQRAQIIIQGSQVGIASAGKMMDAARLDFDKQTEFFNVMLAWIDVLGKHKEIHNNDWPWIRQKIEEGAAEFAKSGGDLTSLSGTFGSALGMGRDVKGQGPIEGQAGYTPPNFTQQAAALAGKAFGGMKYPGKGWLDLLS